MSSSRRFSFHSASAVVAVASLLLASACKEKTPPAPAFDAAPAPAVENPAPAQVDISQCPGCQLAPMQSWSFHGIYADEGCTEPLAQIAPPACAPVPALESTSLTYAEDVGSRKAGETATVTLVEQAAPTSARYRKSGTKCVRADESAVALTPLGCAGSRVCRDATATLTCGECRTFPNGCPDLEETRMYASFTDPGLKGTKQVTGGGGGGNLARLRQCCTALANEAKRQGNAPELATAAAQCTALVNAAGPTGNAPELGALRTMLAGRNIPAICSGF